MRIYINKCNTEKLCVICSYKPSLHQTVNSTIDFWAPTNPTAKASVDKKFAQFALEKLELKSGSAVIETSLDEVLPNFKLDFKADLKDKGDLSALYKLPQATITGEFDIIKCDSAKASISSGYGPVTVGGNGHVLFKDKLKMKEFSVGAGYTVPKLFFIGVRANKNEKASDLGANFHYSVNKDVSIAGAATYPNKSLAFGATYKCNPATALKFKLATDGKLGASAKQTIDSTTQVTAAAALDVHNIGAYKFGITISLG